MIQTTEQKALALVNEVQAEAGIDLIVAIRRTHATPVFEALCRAIERHDADMQRVSDAVQKYRDTDDDTDLLEFIIPKPVDPLVEAFNEIGHGLGAEDAEKFRAALASHGLKIVKEEG